jgi:hypothetical protein
VGFSQAGGVGVGMSDEYVVNGLPLPPLLVQLMQQGKWPSYPDHERILEVIPFINVQVRFPQTVESMGVLTRFAAGSDVDRLFHLKRGSESSTPVELPYLDVEKIINIGTCDDDFDLGVFLDYRTSIENPRVVANGPPAELSDFHFEWYEVAPTFAEFAERLGIRLE